MIRDIRKKKRGSYRIKGKLLAGPDKTPCDVEVSVTPGEKNSFLYDFKLSNPDGITTSMAGGYLKMDWPVTPPKQFPHQRFRQGLFEESEKKRSLKKG